MERREELRDRLSNLQGPKERSLAIGRWVAVNRDELIDGAPEAFVPLLLDIERAYYRVQDKQSPVTELVAAMRAFRDAVIAAQAV